MSRHLTRAAAMLALFAIWGTSYAADRDEALWAAAQKRKAPFVAELRTLVDIDSGTGYAPGIDRIGVMLAQRLRDLGADVDVRDSAPAVGKTVIGTWRGTGNVDVLLMIHYDTVFEAGEAARRPFRIEAGKAYGPGVADAKGGILVVLNALDIARERGFSDYRTLTVMFNPDEERSSLGSRQVIGELAARHDFVLSYEPPEADQVIVATNGVAYVHLDVKGRSSHAGSAPEAGRNAALELAHQLLQLNRLGDKAKGTTVNWTTAQAGQPGRVNVIPDKATALADMRMSDISEVDRVGADATRISRNRLIPDTEVNVVVESRRPPFGRNAATGRLAELAKKIGSETGVAIAPVAMGYGTDAGFAYRSGAEKPVVLEGLGIVGDKIHTPDEWADLDSIPGRLYLTVRLLEALGQGQGR